MQQPTDYCSEYYRWLSDDVGFLSAEEAAELAAQPDVMAQFDYDLWKPFRDMFPFAGVSGGVIPMNCANLCPRPTLVTDRVNAMRTRYNLDVSQQLRTTLHAGTIQFARLALARQLGVRVVKTDEPRPFDEDAPDLALVRNGTEGNNVVCATFKDWKPGDNVVVWDENHPTNLGVWQLHAQRRGFTVKPVSLRGTTTPEEQVARFQAAIEPGRTRFLAFSETSSLSGRRLADRAIAELVELAHGASPAIHVHMDGAQTLGTRRLDLSALGIDSFSASTHKWYFGPKETGVLYMRPGLAHRFDALIYGYDYRIRIDSHDALPATARRFEYIGQRDDVNLMGLLETCRIHEQIHARGLSTEERVSGLATELKGHLTTAGWSIETPTATDISHGVVVVNTHGREDKPGDIAEHLYRKHRIATSGAYYDGEPAGQNPPKRWRGGLRLCPHVYNNGADLGRVIMALRDWRA